jgi:hypothetical protein
MHQIVGRKVRQTTKRAPCLTISTCLPGSIRLWVAYVRGGEHDLSFSLCRGRFLLKHRARWRRVSSRVKTIVEDTPLWHNIHLQNIHERRDIYLQYSTRYRLGIVKNKQADDNESGIIEPTDHIEVPSINAILHSLSPFCFSFCTSCRRISQIAATLRSPLMYPLVSRFLIPAFTRWAV